MMGTCDHDMAGCSPGHPLLAWGFGLGLKSKLITSHLLAPKATPATELALELIDQSGRRLAHPGYESRW